MARSEDHLAELLRRPMGERARAARALLESLDDGNDEDAERAQLAEIARRIDAVDAGTAKLIPPEEARERLRARIRAVRGEK